MSGPWKLNTVICLLVLSFIMPGGIAHTAVIEIPINPVRELNGKDQNDILDLRYQYIAQVPELAPQDYRPNLNIFGRIEDDKPWWGLLGISYYGPGNNSILGNAKESRFIVNPYNLFGIEELNVSSVFDRKLPPIENYPMPTKLVWDESGKWAVLTYNVTSYHQTAVQYHNLNAQDLYLSNYNPRDLDFNYFTISSSSQNIAALFDTIFPIIQFIHTGESCRFPGGCNNKSPAQKELKIQWNALPARIKLKLWRERPLNTEQAPDMDFIIVLN